ncbi:beta-phosphoglucomutase [Lentibacillus saliphilus]|uniref:beta-phosphoglucomutase n=1 Tax=Lentibacillus saliphilus TaxID=2737028 RepID=UPI001C2FC7AF|nr:beta-phosphoglucomutase [Lentibacillus saliphilus]
MLVEAFIFDLDGVITDTAEYHFKAWKSLAEDINISFDRHFNEQLKGVSRMESLELILAKAEQQNDYTENEKEKLVQRKNEHYQQMIATLSPDDILPGISDLLGDIQEAGYRLGLASASKNAPFILRALELDNLFDTIADVEKIDNGKPAPDIFLLAAAELNACPAACIGIEDAASGVTAIRRAGMFSVGVGDKDILQDADLIVSSTAELDLNRILSSWERR